MHRNINLMLTGVFDNWRQTEQARTGLPPGKREDGLLETAQFPIRDPSLKLLIPLCSVPAMQ
jgi:hypothetical protein